MWARLQQARIVPLPPVLPPINAQKIAKIAKINFLDHFAAVIHHGATDNRTFRSQQLAA
jgi:hypothetical protein